MQHNITLNSFFLERDGHFVKGLLSPKCLLRRQYYNDERNEAVLDPGLELQT